MKAVIFTRYGPPEGLQLQEVDKPSPKDNEVLIRIHASTVTQGDSELRGNRAPLMVRIPLRLWLGLFKPRAGMIFGTELAGEIEAAGQAVTRFKPGNQVMGSAGIRFGANAEYICLPEDRPLCLKPINMSYEEAATVPFGARDALHMLRLAEIKSGEKVVVTGAGGSIGTYALQLAKNYGAEVTAVDSTTKLDMLMELGADRVIDFTQEDFTKRSETYDVIFDAVGKTSFTRSIQHLNENGRYVLANPRISDRLRGPRVERSTSKRIFYWGVGNANQDLLAVKELIEAGKLKAAIDKVYPMEQVAEAHRYVDTGLKKGHVVISIK